MAHVCITELVLHVGITKRPLAESMMVSHDPPCLQVGCQRSRSVQVQKQKLEVTFSYWDGLLAENLEKAGPNVHFALGDGVNHGLALTISST